MENYIVQMKEWIICFANICLEKELTRINKKERSSYFDPYEKGLLNEEGNIDKQLRELNKFQQEAWFKKAVDIFFSRGVLIPNHYEVFSDWVTISTNVEELHAITMEMNKYMNKLHGGKHSDGSWRDVCKIYTSEKLYNYFAFALSHDDAFKQQIIEQLKIQHENYYTYFNEVQNVITQIIER